MNLLPIMNAQFVYHSSEIYSNLLILVTYKRTSFDNWISSYLISLLPSDKKTLNIGPETFAIYFDNLLCRSERESNQDKCATDGLPILPKPIQLQCLAVNLITGDHHLAKLPSESQKQEMGNTVCIPNIFVWRHMLENSWKRLCIFPITFFSIVLLIILFVKLFFNQLYAVSNEVVLS